MGRKGGKRGRGEGTIYQRPDGTWAGQITVGYDPQTRRQTRKTVYGATQQEVRDKLQKARQEAQDASAAVLGGQRVRDALGLWLGQIKNKVRDTSLLKYEKSVEWLNKYLGGLTLAELTPAVVTRAYEQMGRDEVPTSSARLAGVRLRQACKFMVRLGVLSRNPAEGVYLPRHEAGEIRPLTREQARHLLAVARDGKCPMYALWALALDTGARRGELLALEEGDIDWGRGEVSITKNLKEKHGLLELDELKTRSSRRKVRIAPGTLAALKRHLEDKRGRAGPGAPVFSGVRGGHLWASHLYRTYWWPLLERAGLDIRFHDMRHTCATLLLAAGVHVKAVSERLGHSKVTITLETYAHVLPTMQEAVAGTVEGLLWAP